MKARYKYLTGRPSWHQSRAGHSFAATTIVDHSREEHLAFLENHRKRGIPVAWIVVN